LEIDLQFLFADHVLDVDRRELRCGSTLIAVEPQVFDLLNYLLENRDRVVSKDDLIAFGAAESYRIRRSTAASMPRVGRLATTATSRG